jgi:3-hydroxymyristoyl/3-hydroxydecanoyl-(acyl carrier protein) dehydratase
MTTDLQSTASSDAEIQRLICVRHPYYALEHLRVIGRGEVECLVAAEQSFGCEMPPMRAAEAGRHMAILGSCALASLGERQGQHFYLAKTARLEVFPAPSELVPFLRGHARAAFTGRREGQATVTLTTEAGLETHKLIVEYNVLPSATFYRLFAAHRLDLRQGERSGASCVTARHPLRNNPYKDSIPLAALTIEGQTARAEIPVVTPAMCNGHFAEVPLLPVAIVMGSLLEVAGTLFLVLEGKPTARYRVLWAEVTAHRFAEAGKALFLSASLVEATTFKCQATTTDGLVGEMVVSLAGTD